MPLLVNTDYVKTRISETVKSNTGMDIRPGEISISVFPKFHISFKGILPLQDRTSTGQTGRILVYPDLSALFKSRLIIKKIIIEDLNARGLEPAPEKERPDIGKSFSPVFLQNTFKGITRFIHKSKGIHIVFNNLETRFFSGLDASLHLRSENSAFWGTARLQNLSVRGESIVPSWIGNRFQSAKSDTVNIRFYIDEKGNLFSECIINDLALISPEPGNLKLELKKLTLGLDMTVEKTEVRIKAALLKPVLQEPRVSFTRKNGGRDTKLQFRAENVDIETLKEYSDAFIGINPVSLNIFSILESGTSEDVVVTFETDDDSGLFDPKNLIIDGTIDSGIVNIPECELTAENVSGKATMQNGALDIVVDKGNIGNSLIHQGKVSVNLISEPDVPFTARFDLTADLREAPATLSRLLDESVLTKELGRVSVKKGSARIDLLLVKKEGKELKTEVNADEIRLFGRYGRMHDPVEIFDATFRYQDEKVQISRVTAKTGESYIYNTNVEFRVDQRPAIRIRSGKALVKIKEIFPYLLSTRKLNTESFPFSPEDGTVWIDSLDLTLPFLKNEAEDIMISGQARDIKVKSKASPKDGASFFSCGFKVSGNTVSMTDITSRIRNIAPLSDLTGSSLVKNIRTPFEITGGGLEISRENLSFTGNFEFSSGPAAVLSVSRKGEDGFVLKRLSIKDLPATRADFQQTGKKSKFEGYLSSSTLEKIFTREFLSDTDFFKLTQKDHFVVSSCDDCFFKLAAFRLNLVPLLNKRTDFPDISTLLNNKSVHVETNQLDTGDYVLNNVKADIDIERNQTIIRLLKGNLCGIELNGTIVKKGDFVKFETDAAAVKRDDLHLAAGCLFKGKALTGETYSFDGRFSSKAPLPRIKERVSGRLKFTSERGRIFRLTLLSRILSVINVSKVLEGSLPDILQKGFAYNSVSIKADIENSRIEIKEGIIDGRDMTIIFTGDVFPVQRTMNLTFLVAPFKTVDLIIKKIPVLNTLLGGKLVSIPVKAAGTFENPSVMPLHPSAVGTGLTNVMKNIVNTPVKLMEKLP
ncbi:MAG: AsmA-like C-terminal domain-containing protein [Thermodesulfobacteriota bacterium]